MSDAIIENVIRAILFDLGRVIVPFDFQRGFDRMSALRSGDKAPAITLPTALTEDFECGRIEPDAFIEQFSKEASLSATTEQFCEMWNSIFFPETLIGEDLLKTLARDHRLVLLSNTNKIHFEMIERTYPLLRHFHEFVLSYKVGAMKPLALIYEKAIEAAQCQAGECFFTDDILTNIDAARAIGIDAVQFESEAQIKRELAAPRSKCFGLAKVPDPNDRHVLAAAIRGQADVILTANLRDFPAKTLEEFGIAALPDSPPDIIGEAANHHRETLKSALKTVDPVTKWA